MKEWGCDEENTHCPASSLTLSLPHPALCVGVCRCACMCVHCGMKMYSQSKLFEGGGEGEVWGVGDCDDSACSLAYCTVLYRSESSSSSPCRSQSAGRHGTPSRINSSPSSHSTGTL